MGTPLLAPDFKEFLRLLDAHGVEYLLVGGYAVGYYGYPRTTGDLDVWIAARSDNARRVVGALRAFGFTSQGADRCFRAYERPRADRPAGDFRYHPNPARRSRPVKAQKPTPFGLAAERAFQAAVRDAIEEHRLHGVPIAVMRGGKAVNIPAEEAFPGRKKPARKPRPAAPRSARKSSTR